MHPHTVRWSALLCLLLVGCTTWPIENGSNRPTPLHFGLYVTPNPEENPIDPPERFTGFHAGTDFEILPDEEEAAIPVYAICSGELTRSGFTEGYGGLVTQHCTLQGEQVTILYGHLALDSLLPAGILAGTGEQLGILGTARSRDTDGNRKHLHLGIHKGWNGDVRGYVQTEEELKAFIDPQSILE